MVKFIISTILCFIVYGAKAQEICLIDSLTKKKIDSTYLALMIENKVSGMSIAIVDNGKIVYAKGYGFEDVEANIPASSKSMYRIGSITKSFTALSIMQLQSKGLLSVNDELKTHIPEFKIGFQNEVQSPILLRHMMAHISGMPSDMMNGFFTENPPSIDWTIKQTAQMKMSYQSAYSHSYSNLAYNFLGEVVARKSNQKYENYIQTEIFSPLGMKASFIYPDEKNKTPKSYFGKTLVDEPLIADAAAGLIHSNVEDMSKYVMMYLNRGTLNGVRILDSLSILEMENKQTEELFLDENGNFGYGLYSGSYYYKKDNDSSLVKIIGHGGDTYTFHADMKYIPELGVGVVLLTNSTGGNSVNSGQRLLRLYLKERDDAKLKVKVKDSLQNIKNEFEKGTYCITNFVFEANNEKQIKFKQGPAKIKASLQEEGYYTMKAFMFGFIPFKIKNQAFYFENLNGIVYVKALNLSDNSTEYIGCKLEAASISESWKKSFGSYKVINAIPCDECPKMDLNFQNLTLEVSEKNGFLYFKLGGKDVGIDENFFAQVESEKCAISVGIGRSNGNTFRILENGNIFYSGFEFERSK